MVQQDQRIEMATGIERETVLYITPIMPQRFGNGLAMRAASVLEALAQRFDVHLFVVPVAGALGPPSDSVRQHTVRVEESDLTRNLDPLFTLVSRISTPDEHKRVMRSYPKPLLSRFCRGNLALSLFDKGRESKVAGLHVMRLYLAPLAEFFLQQTGSERRFCVLDLDDDDAQTYQRLAALYRGLGDNDASTMAVAEAEKFQAFADRYVPRFDRILTCSERDARRLGNRYPCSQFAVVPNGYPLLEHPRSNRPSAQGTIRLLFVGSFGYFPNVDAALYLCHEVLPALRELTEREIRVDLVGTGDTSGLRAAIRCPSVRLHGFVEKLSPFYAQADVVTVPVRAGGGTRIKLLEAFAHGAPVVTTSVGVEGIDAIDGKHLLCADDARSFARACLRIKENPELSMALTAHAAVLLVDRYSPAKVHRAVLEAWNANPGA